MRVAITHDYLTQRGGAERVVLAMARAFPDAPIHTSLYLPDATFGEFAHLDVRTGPADRLDLLRRHHRLALPLYPLIFDATRVDADVVLCSSSGWAHGARTDGRKVVYCHAPARWLYQRDTYLGGFPVAARTVFPLLERPLRRWDRKAAATADRYLVNSTHTRRMVWEAYGIEAEVLPPPHSIDAAGSQRPVAGLEPGFHLTVSRLLSYKHVVELVEAFRGLPRERLVVVGEGPLEVQLRLELPANAVLLGRVDDDELRWLYANATRLVAVSFEDLGLTPVEAALFGTPTLAIRYGGYLDTVVEGVNGWFVEDPSPAAIRAGVARADDQGLDPVEIRSSASRFDPGPFRERLRDVVAETVEGA